MAIEGYNTDKRLRTVFSSSEEARKYLEILGAEKIGDNKYRLGKVDNDSCGSIECIITSYGIKFVTDEALTDEALDFDITASWLDTLFYKYGMSNSINHSCVCDLEGLVLIYTYFMSNTYDEMEEDFDSNLRHARYEMLSSIVNQKEPIASIGQFTDFDRAVAPFLSDDFDISKFLDECVFSTTGYYKDRGCDKCLHFEWRSEKDPDTIYEINTNSICFDFDTSISFRENNDRFSQKACHIVFGPGDERIHICFNNDAVHITYYPILGKISNEEYFGLNCRKATVHDVARVRAIMNSFIVPNLSFDKAKEKKKVSKADNKVLFYI